MLKYRLILRSSLAHPLALIFLLSSLCFLNSNCQAQPLRKSIKKAEKHFNLHEYDLALPLYQKVASQKPKSTDYQYKLGVCEFQLNNYKQALTHFGAHIKDKKHQDDALYYLAISLHHNGYWEDAARFYKLFVKVMDEKDPRRSEVKKQLLQCITASKLSYSSSPAVVSSLGNVLNSPYDDLNPILHPKNPDILLYSSNRNCHLKNGQELFDAYFFQGKWQNSIRLHSRYQASNKQLLVAFPDKGYQIAYSIDLPNKSTMVYVDNFLDEDSTNLAVVFAPNTQKGSWNSDHYFFSDSLFLFASERPGGYGGKDLYYSLRLPDGNWSDAINMGPIVNSPYDERAPFLAKDGRTLFFSYNGPQSMGGFDIFSTVFSDSAFNWLEPTNMAPPINSAGDDLFFRLHEDGIKGFLSSQRQGGRGGLDIYELIFRQFLQEQLIASEPEHFHQMLMLKPAYLDQKVEQPDIVIRKTSPVIPKVASNNPAEVVYTFNPIYYDGLSGKMEAGYEKTLQNLQSILANYKEVQLILTAHSDDANPLVNNLFLSVTQAELIANELIRNGINANRILLKGCAQNYPVARSYQFDGSPNETGRKFNRRIDIELYNANHLPIRIVMNQPTISSVLADTIAQNYEKRVSGLSYKIQLLNTPSLYTHPILEQMKDASTEKRASQPNITYTIGMAKSFDAIRHLLETAQQMGFEQAQIVPYINGMPINESEAQSIISTYPDLEKYLAYRFQK